MAIGTVFRRKDTNMTEGSITRHLIMFALPLLIGNIFQQLYNTVDSVVVGNFVGKEALAAVGSVTAVINTLIGFFLGLSTGAGVVISQYYGANDEQDVHEAVHTTMVMTFILCAILTVIGVLMVPYMLRFMSTPDDVIDDASRYLRIYFSGVSGLMIYNMGSGILRAVGDSRRPLYFLIFSALTNTVLDLVFVVVCGWGVVGVAIATIISQFLSAILVLSVLTRSKGAYRLVWHNMRLNVSILRSILRIGLPSAFQQAITSFSNVFVQSYVNRFASDCMAGWASYTKLNQFAILPMRTLGLATTTFVGQNLGAHDLERARTGTRRALQISLLITLFMTVPIVIFARELTYLFNQDPVVLTYGTLFTHVISPFYFLCAINMIYAGSLQGAGNAKAPMIIMLVSFVVCRQVYLYVTSELIGTLLPVAFAYPVGWLFCAVIITIYYKFSRWDKNLITSKKCNNSPSQIERKKIPDNLKENAS